MTRRILLVEPSATMRRVMEQHVRALGHEVEATGSYAEATAALEHRFRTFESDIACVVHGWPSLPDESADAFAARLESADCEDLAVVVMSTDRRAETRAWVAGRARTAMLAWKDYLGVDALLERLLEDDGETDAVRGTTLDNADVHVLVVDDSLTIRYSLRDLLELQGYRVSLAATREEALESARRTRFDIALLDFYLEETTGDALCRDLVRDPACGDVVCAILTGTHTDHVIKRSLRAGAVECLFKNESSELLLTRIDAIGRSVRRRRELGEGVARLGRVVESLAGAVLVVDAEARLRYASGAALAELGLDSLASVAGQSVHDLLGIERLPPPSLAPVPMRWRDATGGSIAVGVTRRALIGTGDESLVGFERVAAGPAGGSIAESAAGAEPESGGATASAAGSVAGPMAEAGRAAPPGTASAAGAVVERLRLPRAAVPFVERLGRYVETAGTRTDRVSLLVLGVFERQEDGTHRPIAASGPRAERVGEGIRRLYRREHHVAALGGHRHGLLIRHVGDPQSYLLTRRLMQLCEELLVEEGGPVLASTGCLVGLSTPVGRGAELLLGHALRGLELVDARGVGQALLLDLRRMLAVRPGEASGALAPGGTTPGARPPGAARGTTPPSDPR